MDADLNRRFDLFEQTGQVDPDISVFVREELLALERDGYAITDETAGAFATHVLMALQRCRRGEPVEPTLAEDVVAAELAQRPDAVVAAKALNQRAAAVSVELPATEVSFVALHLAALTMSSQSVRQPETEP
ncbi:MAG: transcriptional antiterminator, BglG [Dactylosporangium sp.]|nr:transcriptional antiterminator, BglG [Dactylosporangium sp.]